MRSRFFIVLGILILTVCGVTLAQKPFREWPAIEYEDFPLPPDYQKPAEWTRARLRYPDIYGYPQAMLVYNDGRPYPGYWTMDYPRSDRHLLEGVRRLTRIDTRSVEQVVSFGEDDMYNYPVLYAVEVGHWQLGDAEARQLREYLDRGGFLMVDDFHGSEEWAVFIRSLRKVFPDREVEDLPNDDPIFHVLYDLQERFQVPGAQYFETGITYEKGPTGKDPHWRAIRDDKGRVQVAICHNMDLGDAWEHSDEARYLEKWAGLAYKIAMNYFIYDLTH
ncbi:MAG TPA: DUF4159 domain-containing protein [Bryobacteraceae bacterium]|nr:DUF4159 domain-containing protein [Bryobacteraceae bacterium]